jgi:hypothetical protein
LKDKLHDLIFLPEATLSINAKIRGKQLKSLQQAGYAFESSPSGSMAVYIKNELEASCHCEFPAAGAISGLLAGRVGVVRSKDERSWAVVGVYAPAMQVNPRPKAAGPAEREAFDRFLLSVLEGLRGVRTVALVDNLNFIWARRNDGQKGHDAVLGSRWRHTLLNMGYGEPFDRKDILGKVVPTSRPYPRRGKGGKRVKTPVESRVDFLFVRSTPYPQREDAVTEYGSHAVFYEELSWPAYEMPKISEHAPLSVHLRVEDLEGESGGGASGSEQSGKKRAREEKGDANE